MRRRLAALSCRRCSVSWAQGDGRQQEDKHHSPPSDSTDVKMASCPGLCGSEYGDGGPQRYGVRSYLHQFYEDCTSSIWERHHDEFQMQRSPSRWSSVLWKVCVAVGAVILVSGLSVLLVGYATPPRLEAFGEDELLFVDGRAMRFNRALDACKLGGAVLFCVGGAGVAAGLLLLAVCGQGGAKDELQLQRRFKERLAEIQASVPNPGDAKVPVTLSKVQNIQPGAEP